MKWTFYSLVMANLISQILPKNELPKKSLRKTTISLNDTRRFRCDYTYIKNIHGYIKYHEIPSNWDEAQLRCRLEGAMLMSPTSLMLKKAMMSLVNHSSVCGIYTGIHSKFAKGDFHSIDGIRLSAFNHTWAPEEPNNDIDEESCIAMLPDGTIADVRCNETLPYICYKKNDKNMKMYKCGPDKGYGYCKNSSKCYKFHTSPRVWSRAYLTCSAENGHLAIINNPAEIDALKQMFQKMHARRMIQSVATFAFLGFRYWDGEWRTIHGQTLEEAGYGKFSPGQNITLSSKTCGGIDNSANLVLLPCDKESIFICEKEIESRACLSHKD